MPTRKILALSVILVVLAAAAFFVQGPGRRHKGGERAEVFPGLDPAAVASVTIARPEGTLVLSRAGEGEWRVGEEGYPGDGEAVGRALGDLGQLRLEAVASTNLEKKSLFGVDEEKGIALRLESSSGDPVAEFVVGDSGPDLFSGYLLKEGDDRVLLVSSNLRSVYGRPLSDWRDRKIVTLEAGEVTTVTIEKGEERFALERGEGDEWSMAGRPVDRRTVEDYLGRVVNLRAAGFPGAEEAGSAFDERRATILLGTGEGSLLLTVGALEEESGLYAVRTDASDVVYLVSRYSADALLRGEGDFPPPGSAGDGGEKAD
jgi:hypothetical protein